MRHPPARIPLRAFMLALVQLAMLVLPLTARAIAPPPVAARWHQIPLLPPANELWSMPAVFDPPRHRVILLPENLGVGGDAVLWMLDTHDPGGWIAQPVLGAPPPSRRGCAAVYDPIGDRIVVLAGTQFTSSDVVTDVWTLDLSGGIPVWSHPAITGSLPSVLFYPSATYDPLRHRVLMFGGGKFVNGQGTTLSRDVWALDLSTFNWSLIPALGGGPTPRYRCAAAYDPVRDRLIVHAGGDSLSLWSTYGPRSDAWALSLSGTPTWTQLTQGAGGSDGYLDHVAIFDPVRDGMLLIGGSDSTWYPPTYHSEVRILPLDAPSPLEPFVDAVPDPNGVRFVVEDPAQRVVFAQGGAGTNDRSTWRLNLDGDSRWTQVLGPEIEPHTRFGQAQAYDARRGRTIFFGGRYTFYVHYEYPTTFYDDLWSLELKERPIWTPLDDGGPRPPTRQNATLVPDATADRMWLFGGNVTVGISGPEPSRMTIGSKGTPKYYGDLWQLDLAPTPHWTQVTTTGPTPGPRDGHVTIVDSRRRRMLVFGGRDSLGPKNDLWSLSLDAPHVWTRLMPIGPSPAARAFAAGGYDIVSDQLVIQGGVDAAGTSLTDVWTFRLGGTPVWVTGTTEGTSPATFGARPYFFDRGRRRLVVIGTGTTQTGDQASISVLSLGQSPPLWTRLGAEVHVPDDVVGRSAVWDESANAIVALWGADGARGEYVEEVGWRIELEEAASGPVAVPPISAERFRLSAAPNPARGAFRIHAAGLRSGEATLELMDAQGRRVAQHSLRNAEGQFELAFERGRLAPGLYLVRLTQGKRTAMTKIVVFE